MSLQYNILWVDDRKDEYLAIEMDKDIEDYVKELFFQPCIDIFDNVNAAEECVKFKKYDVIFSDYNIGESKDGSDFINDIRSQNVNAEVLFYSALHNPPPLSLDRISFFRLASSAAYDDLKNKMKSMIDLSVEKLNCLTNLRGLVMSEVSALDVLMEDIIAKYYIEKGNEIKRQGFNKHIVKNSENTLRRRLKKNGCDKVCVHTWYDADFSEIIKEMDASQKARTINLVISELSFLYTSTMSNFYEDYFAEMIEVRNNLAHCTSFYENGTEILKTRKNPSVTFSCEDVKIIRQNIRKYRDVFENLSKMI